MGTKFIKIKNCQLKRAPPYIPNTLKRELSANKHKHKHIFNKEPLPQCSQCNNITTTEHIMLQCEKTKNTRMKWMNNKRFDEILDTRNFENIQGSTSSL